jgi:AraC-like DNA-binding protein
MKIVRSDQAWRVLRANASGALVLESLAHRHGYRVCEMCMELGCGERYLHATFVRDIGLSPKMWLRQERMLVARRLLRDGRSADAVGEDLGFSTLNNFRREFREVYGLSPLQYQRRFFARC